MPIEANVRRQQQEALASVTKPFSVSAFAVPRAIATPSKLVVSQIEPLK
jgi:hypothetical protein